MIEIIPAIDIIDGKCVRLSQGDYVLADFMWWTWTELLLTM